MALFNVIHGDRIPPSAFNVKMPVFRLPRWLVIAWLVLKILGLCLFFAVRFWRMTVPATVGLYVYFGYGWGWLLALVVTLAAGFTGWAFGHRDTFDRFAWWPVLARCRRFSYRRKWYAAMHGVGLAKSFNGAEYLPILKKVRTRYGVDTLTVKIVTGQTPDDYATAAYRLAHAFGVRTVKALHGQKPHLVELSLRRGDPLIRTVAPLPIPVAPDLTGLPVAVTEEGETFNLRLFGAQILVVGATDSGKGSVIWSVIRSLAPGIAYGTVKVWGFDPKGMELAPGAPLFDKLVCDGFDEMADLLDQAVKIMRTRAANLRGKTRQHVPSVDEPLYLIVIDELAALTAYLTDRALKERIKNALGLLLTQGRAVGVHVLACLQDPRKEAATVRDLFPTRIALRLTEASHVDMVLGDGARDRGAHCDRIPMTLPGVGYVALAGNPTPVRVRFSYLTDNDIRTMADSYTRFGVINGSIVGPLALVEVSDDKQ